MIKKLTAFLDYGVFAEAALAIFAIVFLAIVIRTLMIRDTDSRRHAQLVLGDEEKTQ